MVSEEYDIRHIWFQDELHRELYHRISLRRSSDKEFWPYEYLLTTWSERTEEGYDSFAMARLGGDGVLELLPIAERPPEPSWEPDIDIEWDYGKRWRIVDARSKEER